MRTLLCITLLVTLVMLSVTLPTGADGDTYIVDDSDPVGQWSTHDSIQDAIDAASRGDTVLIYNGTYYEDVNVSEEVDLIGNGSSGVFLECSGLTHGINVTTWNVNVTGMSINNTKNGSLHGGLRLWWARYAQVSDMVATNGGNGLLVHSSDNVNVHNVHFHGNGYHGIYSYISDELAIARVNASYNYRNGINFYRTNESNVSRSQVHQNNAIDLYHGAGVYISQTGTCSLYDNTITNNRYHGAMAYQSTSIEFVENHIFKNCGGDAGILLEETSDCHVHANNISGNTGQGVELYESCKRNRIENNTLNDNGRYGARIGEGSNDTKFIGNVVMGNDDHAVRLYDAGNVTIKWNQIIDNEGTNKYAMNVHFSEYVHILENNISGNVLGVLLSYSDLITVAGNNISDHPGTPGINVDTTDDLIFMNNTISWNEVGINVNSCDDIQVLYNEIFNNSAEGVYFGSTVTNGTVHHNNFQGNGYDASDYQARDNGANDWDDGAEGNWWSDWNGSGRYHIPGTGDRWDNYPLGDPVETSAPEKVPEFPPVLMVSAVIVMAFAFRRRRK